MNALHNNFNCSHNFLLLIELNFYVIIFIIIKFNIFLNVFLVLFNRFSLP